MSPTTAIRSQYVTTPRLATHYLSAGDPDGVPVLLVHGNVSSSAFFDELLQAFPSGYHVIAPDLRGYGDSAAAPVDATRGLKDFADDLHSLVATLGLGQRPIHWLGWSMGGGVIMEYALRYPQQVASLTLVAPVSPFGFGGSHGEDGAWNTADCAGAGGGTVNPIFVERIKSGDTTATDGNSPRSVMNAFYFKPPFTVNREREDAYVAAMNKTFVGADNYPGDMQPSAHWPNVAPGSRGVLNTMAPSHFNVSGLAALQPQPPILWVRGDSDQIVADQSFFDFATLGLFGAVPGWPGMDACPPQPMIAQLRAVLERYRANGGRYRELVLPECGHAPFIEKAAEFQAAYFPFLAANR